MNEIFAIALAFRNLINIILLGGFGFLLGLLLIIASLFITFIIVCLVILILYWAAKLIK